ncbi:MAG: DsrE family protein [Clostridium sp.]|uniref:DsrE family protein n=1 Tax=Clostridium sp. TaxID=1506 RepID=UPI0039ECB318
MKERKVIFHIDELNKWKLLLGNINNLINALQNEIYNIEVVANAEAVKLYDFNNNFSSEEFHVMEDLSHKKVKFVACNNALKSYGIQRENLMAFVLVVPAGILELIDKQKEGYAYIKP